MADVENPEASQSVFGWGLEYELRFYKLLARISARFVSVPAAEVDFQIEDALREICEFLQIDHSTVWQGMDDHGVFVMTHVYRDPTLRPRPARMIGS